MVVGATPQTDISWYIRWKLGKHQAISQTCWDGTNIGRIVTTVGFCTCPCKHIQQAMIPHEYVKSQLRRAVRKIETVHTKLCTLALTACMLNWGCVYFHDGLASSCFPCAHWVAQSYLEANHDGKKLPGSLKQPDEWFLGCLGSALEIQDPKCSIHGIFTNIGPKII